MRFSYIKLHDKILIIFLRCFKRKISMRHTFKYAIYSIIIALFSTYSFTNKSIVNSPLIFTKKASNIFKKKMQHHFPDFEKASKISRSSDLLNQQLPLKNFESAFRNAQIKYYQYLLDNNDPEYSKFRKLNPIPQFDKMFNDRNFEFGWYQTQRMKQAIVSLIIESVLEAESQNKNLKK